ncbi:MAG: CDP-alcohol phosphatidyltransferase family protein [Pyrinomonadaceae bacterium]|nr:CDP-alcohol phosphatidyltransferase family protein [Pyrinomonadaceae bacterium]
MADEETKPPHRGLKKGLYVIPTLFTAANVAMGFFAVLWSIRGFQAIGVNAGLATGYFNYAAVAIGLAILFDTMDGRVARATRTATEIGVQFDSLADVLTFGIAPTALIYSWAIAPTFAENSPGYGLGIFVLFMFLMCGAFRLARFNLQASRPHVLIEGAPKLDKKAFVGLPIPPAGGLLAAIVHFSPAPLTAKGEAAAQYYAYALLGLIAALAILMVSTIRYSSMKAAGGGRKGFFLVLALAAVGMAIWFYSQYVLLVLAVAYTSHGVIWWLLRPIFVRPAASQKG